jgi:5-methylcytosine-specific restriction endonuclease McrA
MRVDVVNNVSFKYVHPLKKAFDKGLLGKDFKGLYGIKLNSKNRTLEHIIPHSLGGGLNWGNTALADKTMNSKRGIKPIEEFVTFDMWKAYLKQFEKIKNEYVNGMYYIKQICKARGFKLKEILND